MVAKSRAKAQSLETMPRSIGFYFSKILGLDIPNSDEMGLSSKNAHTLL